MSNPQEGAHHFDRFYTFFELPAEEQKEHADWAEEDEQFVRMIYAEREEFIPLENFMQATQSPVGHKIDGFATDSYFSGTALRLLSRNEQLDTDADYEIWNEYW